GQALSYMVGRLEIQRVRAAAAKALGDRFDTGAVHDVVLLTGLLPLNVLDESVRDWVAERAGQVQRGGPGGWTRGGGLRPRRDAVRPRRRLSRGGGRLASDAGRAVLTGDGGRVVRRRAHTLPRLARRARELR